MRNLNQILEQNKERILVVDATHGGYYLAESLDKLSFDVILYDIYNSLSKGKKNGIRILKKIPDIGNFDVVISPVHSSVFNPFLDNKNMDVFSFHEVINWIIGEHYRHIIEKMLVIEITGTKGKTTTATILSRLIEGDPLILSSSDGVYLRINGEFRKISSGSITPVRLLELLDLINTGRIPLPKCFIFEVSLGFTGIGDVNVMTSLDYNYKIAGGRLNAVFSKLKSLENTDGIVIVPDIHYEYFNSLPDDSRSYVYRGYEGCAGLSSENVFTYEFEHKNEGLDVMVKNLKLGDIKFQTKISPLLIENAVVSIITLKLLKLLNEGVLAKMNEISNIEGRCEVYSLKNKVVISDQYAIFEPEIIGSIIKWAEAIMEDKGCVIIGGKKNFCGTMDDEKIEKIAKIANNYEGWKFYFSGEIGEMIISRLKERASDFTLIDDIAKKIERNRSLVIIGDIEIPLKELSGDENGH